MLLYRNDPKTLSFGVSPFRWTLFFLFLFLVTGCSKPPVEKREVAFTPVPAPKSFKIVIDAGHGGKDEGTAKKYNPAYDEKSLNLRTALLLNTALRRMGYETILTRGNDSFVPLGIRSAIANGNKANVFVSVHYNSAPNRKAQGVEVYYYQSKEDPNRTAASKSLADAVLKSVIQSTQAASRGVKHGNFAVIRETAMPAILVEGGFLTNEQELAKIRSPLYMKKLAESIAAGVDLYLKSYKF